MKHTKRESGIDGVSGKNAPKNLKREPIVNRNPYNQPSVSAKPGGRAQRSRKV